MRRGQRPFLRSATAIVRTILRWRLQPAQTCSAILLSVLICSFQKPMTFVTRSSWPLVFFYISFFQFEPTSGPWTVVYDRPGAHLHRTEFLEHRVSRVPRTMSATHVHAPARLHATASTPRVEPAKGKVATVHRLQQRRRDGRPNHHRASASVWCAQTEWKHVVAIM